MIHHFKFCGNEVHKFYCCIAKMNTQRCGKEEDLAYLAFASLLPLNPPIKMTLFLGKERFLTVAPHLAAVSAVRLEVTSLTFPPFLSKHFVKLLSCLIRRRPSLP